VQALGERRPLLGLGRQVGEGESGAREALERGGWLPGRQVWWGVVSLVAGAAAGAKRCQFEP
jgi:hypothetical protein